MQFNPTDHYESLIMELSGLGASHIVHDLANMVIFNKPQIVFRSETRKTATWMERVRYNVHVTNGSGRLITILDFFS